MNQACGTQVSNACIFCNSPCLDLLLQCQKSTPRPLRVGRVAAAKDANLTAQSQLALDFKFEEENNPHLREHLKVFFILKKILKISDEKLCQFLNQSHLLPPETWFNVCLSCHPQVIHFYEGVKEINRLHRKLARIEAELKGKIRSSQIDVNDRDSKSIWAQIRAQVAGSVEAAQHQQSEGPNRLAHCDQQSESFGDHDSLFNQPVIILKHECDDEGEEFQTPIDNKLTEEWNSGTTFIKDEHDSSDSSSSSSSSNFDSDVDEHLSNLESISDFQSDVDDDDSDEDITPPQKVSKKNSSSKLEITSENRVQKRKPVKKNNKKNTIRHWDMSNPNYILFSRGKQTFYGCRQCPADYPILEELESHLKAHEENSGGVACSEKGCGWYILPENLEDHRKTRHLPPEQDVTSEEEEQEKSHKNPKFFTRSQSSSSSSSSFLDSDEDENHFQDDVVKDDDEDELDVGKLRGSTCPHCTYPVHKKKDLKTHLKVHQKGADSLPCPECGWYVFEEKLAHHLGLVHKIREPVGRKNPRKKYYYKCSDCGALLCTMRSYRDHLLLHNGDGHQGEVCPECGWLCRRLFSHNARWHSEKGKKEGGRAYQRPREIRVMKKGATVTRKANI
ncbi:unnamed protein product [Orchesella dallaii]|uniref:C2H2-type domain-containing protein n=1 Tax=Orchesella dallaii TaxID=48710 RepID=A0ABP1R2N0_9HEXA